MDFQLKNLKLWPVAIDSNTQAISRPSEHGNVYCGCKSIRKFRSYFAINQNVKQLIEAQHHNPEGSGFDFQWVISFNEKTLVLIWVYNK